MLKESFYIDHEVGLQGLPEPLFSKDGLEKKLFDVGHSDSLIPFDEL
jgi:hypothetical protein